MEVLTTKKLKVAVYGSAEESSNLTVSKAREMGELIAKRGHSVVTGACSGVPYEAVRAASRIGGETIGYSPARNKREHIEKFKDPTDHFSVLKFIPTNYEHGDNKHACYKYRNINTVLHADKIIIIGGRMGTLNEFTIAFELGKDIGILTGTGGAADAVRLILKKVDKATGASIYFSNSPKVLLKRMRI